MLKHPMGVCLLVLGLATAAAAREGREFPPYEPFSSECDCEELRVQMKQFLRLQEERITSDLIHAMQLHVQQAERIAQEALQHHKARETALAEALLLQEQRTEAAVRDALRLQGQETASALREAVRQVLQERDEAALRRTLDERLQRLEEGARAFGEPSTPSPEREDAAAPAAATGGPAPLQQLERRVLDLETTCNRIQPLSTPQAPPATPSPSTPLPSPSAPAPPPATAPSAPEASAAGGAVNDGRDEQAERRRVEQRIQEMEARRERAREQPSSQGQALCIAAYSGSLHEVQRLLDEGADVNYTNSAERVPLYAAIWSSRSPQEKLSLLLRRGADPNAVDKDGWSALHYAAAEGKSCDVLLLLGAGAEVNARTKSGSTPLHVAALWDNETAVRALLAGGARKDLKAWSGALENKTPFDNAKSETIRNLLRA